MLKNLFNLYQKTKELSFATNFGKLFPLFFKSDGVDLYLYNLNQQKSTTLSGKNSVPSHINTENTLTLDLYFEDHCNDFLL